MFEEIKYLVTAIFFGLLQLSLVEAKAFAFFQHTLLEQAR